MNLTKEHFDQMIEGLATKKDLALFATAEELLSVSAKIDQLQDTLDAQGTTLDSLAKQTKDWNVEVTVMRNRMERYESALKVLAAKLDLDVGALLN
jgi:predicted  nucleic acid-binding Zn-ribbon protein